MSEVWYAIQNVSGRFYSNADAGFVEIGNGPTGALPQLFETVEDAARTLRALEVLVELDPLDDDCFRIFRADYNYNHDDLVVGEEIDESEWC